MTKLGPIEFDDRIINALRDNSLVIFAGAGVSMGAPSNLPSFEKLASSIAGYAEVASDPIDRYLGQLKHTGVPVHERAARLLSHPNSAPNVIHRDLMRLFGSAANIRLVTTNFDLHFETSAQTEFGNIPKVYEAPALPLGREFNGIVHVHGSLSQPDNMVLTDADFGRAYLTEGWARRFLVEVFRKYTVLFIGYSHTDTVMTYLARALPVNGIASRFVLTDNDENWNLLGIIPIRFNQREGDNPFAELYEGAARLADRVNRGALDWQTRIGELAVRVPPIDEEAVGEIEQALREVHTTRFLTKVAKKAEWPSWLNNRKHLDNLFNVQNLNERDNLLVTWLADNFAIEYPDAMFDLIASHGLHLNGTFWWRLGCEIGSSTNGKSLEKPALKRWVMILLATIPDHVGHHVLLGLAERCAVAEEFELTLKVFLAMSKHRLQIKPGFVLHENDDENRPARLDASCPIRSDHWALDEVWTKYLRPNIQLLAQPLLLGAIRQFEEIFHDLSIWRTAPDGWDSISYGRSAIEPHAQDQYPEAIDVLTDSARDVLEWLATNNPIQLNTWVELLMNSGAPMLRRLSLHIVATHPLMSADARLQWLLERFSLYSVAEHHEIYRFVGLNYGASGADSRQAVINGILTYQNSSSWGDWSAEKSTAYSHFNWLSWLNRSKDDCPLMRDALEPIKLTYPDWREPEHPDFTHWGSSASWVGDQSPWSMDQLLADEPSVQLDKLLEFNGTRFRGPDRNGLIAEIKEACKKNVEWAFLLADSLVKESLWNSDIWPAFFRGLQEAELTLTNWRNVLKYAAQPELNQACGYDIANLLYAIVRDGGIPFAADLIDQANGIALSIWNNLESHESDANVKDWLSRAINRPAGIISEFWINSLSLYLGAQAGQKVLPGYYKNAFSQIIEDPTSNGGLGRSVILSQIAFLFGLDEEWTRQQLIPFFTDNDEKKFSQAWDGYLVWGRLYPTLVDALMPAFLIAVARLGDDFPDRRQRFIEFYAAVAVFYLEDPTQQFLPNLFNFGSIDDRIRFAGHISILLRQMEPDSRQRLCHSWLLRYWKERQQSLPVVLNEAEIRHMLDWLPCLGESYPEAVSLAIRSPKIKIEHSRLLYDLQESDLVTSHPTWTAELLIYLSKCDLSYNAAGFMAVVNRLPVVPPELLLRLREGLATAGLG